MNTLGYLVVKRPVMTITMVLTCVLVGVPFALALAFPSFIGVKNHLLGSGFTKPGSESVQAGEKLEKSFQLSTHNSLIIVYHSNSDLLITDTAVREAIGKSLERIKSYTGHVTSTISLLNNPDPSLVSTDQKTTYAVLNMGGSDQEVQNLVSKIQEASRIEGLDVKVGGGPAFYYDLQNQGKHDIFKLEIFGVLAIAIALIILGRIFQFGLSALLALGIAVLAIPPSWAVIFLIAHFRPVSVFAMSIASMLSLAYTTNYSLLLIKTYRRHSHHPQPGVVRRPEAALRLTIKEAGETVLGAGLVAIAAGTWLAFANNLLALVGLGGLTSGANLVFQSIGLAALISAAVSVLVSLSFTLALLKIKPRWFQGSATPIKRHSFWKRWDAWVYDHPLPSLFSGLVIVALIGSGVFVFQWTWAAFDSIPKDAQSRQAQTLLAENFGEGETSPLFIIYDSRTPDGLWQTQSQIEIDAITSWLSQSPAVSRVESVTNIGLKAEELQAIWQQDQLSLLINANAQITLIKVTPVRDFSNEATLGLARDLRIRLTEASLQGKVQIAGVPIENVDFLDYDREQLDVMLSGMGLILGLAILVLTGKPVLALKAVLMAALAYLLALGSLAWIFTGLGLSAGLNGTVPAILLILLAASGTDFEYFILNPARQHHDLGATNREAVLQSLDENRPIILVGAVMLFLAFGVWHLSVVEPVKQIGDGQALGILADVLLIRFVMIPAFMSLMGESNWWSPKLKRRRKQIKI